MQSLSQTNVQTIEIMRKIKLSFKTLGFYNNK